ncbi:hypothetical protein JAAARDRAFT_195123 [Jaapia argillacea MUCL 33604]|uniref:Integrase catalytic domain-containing protein n=1 Tax=Jaapia argillacea MUCL 33604 TaxID=933084 RepID=A0A067PNW6_9AGAM|nr:hypothetical protein JAAARDRAFT_195123 [Jaapia argillacea MUCL 33604]
MQPNTTINRWIAGILLFDFKLVHVPGMKHGAADGLSRRARAPEDEDKEEDFEAWIDSANGFTILMCNRDLPPLRDILPIPFPSSKTFMYAPINSNPLVLALSENSKEIPHTDKAQKGPFVVELDFLAAKYGVRHIRISAYNSQANRIVETKHFDIREAIMKAADGDKSKWPSVVDSVFWAKRVTIQKSTGYSPFYLAHGVEPILLFDLAEATYMLLDIEETLSMTDLITLRARQLQKREEDLASDYDFKLGSLVLVRNTGIEKDLNRKTKPQYLGPMKVVERRRGSAYIVVEMDGSISKLPVAAFQIIPYRLHFISSSISSSALGHDATRDSEQEVMRHDSDSDDSEGPDDQIGSEG